MDGLNVTVTCTGLSHARSTSRVCTYINILTDMMGSLDVVVTEVASAKLTLPDHRVGNLFTTVDSTRSIVDIHGGCCSRTFRDTFAGLTIQLNGRKLSRQVRLELVFQGKSQGVLWPPITLLLDQWSDTPRIKTELLAILNKDLEKGYRTAVEHARFLLGVELDGEPATHNPYFNRVKRFKAAQSTRDPNSGELVDHLVTHMSNAKYTIRELHDILEAYYKVARKRFVDNVRMQVIDWHLVKGPNSPLKYFSPTFISTLDAKQLDRIVGEEPGTRMKRHKLVKQIKSLEEGKQILLEG